MLGKVTRPFGQLLGRACIQAGQQAGDVTHLKINNGLQYVHNKLALYCVQAGQQAGNVTHLNLNNMYTMNPVLNCVQAGQQTGDISHLNVNNDCTQYTLY